MASVISDLKYAVRALLQSPSVTGIAVLSFALGIGSNTAIFTLLDQLLLRLLPVHNPEQLVMIHTTGPHMGNNRGSRAASYPMYQDFQQRAPAFSHVFCRYLTPASVNFEGRTERTIVELVSGNYFDALGVRPALGRVLTPEQDDRVYKGHPHVVISHSYWASRFNGDPGVIGKKLVVNNFPMEIVGVSAAGFHGLDPSREPQVRVPIQMKPVLTPGNDDLGNRRSQWINMFARLKPGESLESAKASLQPLLSQILQEEVKDPNLQKSTPYYRNLFLKRQVVLTEAGGGYSQARENLRTALTVLMCMVSVVLLIACFNVANLLIARAVARQKEIAVRLAIGASGRQLLRQLVMESLLLSLAGAVLGILFSYWTIRALLGILPTDGTPLLLRAQPDFRILLFSMTLAVTTGIVFGLAPALQTSRIDLWTTLKDGAGAVVGGSGALRLRKGLVAGQVALSFILLAGAGLFVQSLGNLKNTPTGFDNLDNLITFQVDPGLSGYDGMRVQQFYRQLSDRIASTPGVKAASYAAVAVLHGSEWDSTMSVEGHQAKDGEDMQAFMNRLAPGYWRTMGVELAQGRDFEPRDQVARANVAIVNRKFARHFFGNQSPIGRRIAFGSRPDKFDIEIVGLVDDALYEGPREGVRRQVFVPWTERSVGSATFYVRAELPPETLFAQLRGQVRDLDAAMPIYEMKTVRTQLDETLTTERLVAALSFAFGALATVLAAIGLYGLTAFSVERRTKEIGLRMALGAQQRQVLVLILGELLLLVALGLMAGVPAALYASRYVSSQLFGVPPADWTTGLGALTVLLVVAAVAGFAPARRATLIDAIRALRYE